MNHVLKWVAWVLVIIGGLNWGLVGLFDFNLVQMLFGMWPVVVQVIYFLVGLGAVVLIVYKFAKPKHMMRMKRK